MAAFHWEARMKQDMIDRRAMRAKVQSNSTMNCQASTPTPKNPYDDENIRAMASELSKDYSSPTPSLVNRSIVKIARSQSREGSAKSTEEEEMSEEQTKSQTVNRYSSVDYMQQY